MVNTLFPRFLDDLEQYTLSERYWENVWDRVDPRDRTKYGWLQPWLGTGAPEIKDGNPIFSAWSPTLGRGLRVIQVEPVGSDLEIQMWFDTFGGEISDPDPDRIHELVISCVLSEEASKLARSVISRWVRGEIPSLESGNPDRDPNRDSARPAPWGETVNP